MRVRPFHCALVLLLVGTPAAGQGALSLQGLGFPPGQISTRAEGVGGASAEFDASSATNPAALALVGSSSLFMQYSPEYRRVTAGSGSASTTTARFPVLGAVIPMGGSWTLGFSASTFLDRSFETRSQRRERVGDLLDSVDVTERLQVLGAINDLRLGLGWAATPRFRLGGAAHLFSGRNRAVLEQLYPDTSTFTSSSQESRVSYAGFAGSVGVAYSASSVLGLALSARKGGELRAQSGDTALADATIPDRISAGITYDGITGANLSARFSRDRWSSLRGLSGSAAAFDGWEASIGAEAGGPRIMQRIVTLRAGARRRTLPFGYDGAQVSETAFMAGLGVPLTRNRATFDFALQRAARSAEREVTERGFILSFGLRVSP